MPGVVSTMRDKCKRCYSCVRNCPAKAIKVSGGQAEVIEERCIGCGNCFKVCAQKAKEIRSAVGEVNRLLAGPAPVLACLAPSFPAAFPNVKPGQVVTALRHLGFAEVLEVAFGAQLLAREYTKLVKERPGQLIITTPCPALIGYVEKYAPSLVPNLAPIVSPMIALGRVVKEKYRPEAQVVFIGPCIAKKLEIEDEAVAGVIDAALTFQGFQRMLDAAGIVMASLPESDFDGPHPGIARIFPVSGGLLKTAAMRGDVLENDILVTEGRDNVLTLLRELEHNRMAVKFVDILFCEGCINGPVILGDDSDSIFKRKEIVTDYVRQRITAQDQAALEAALDEYAAIDLRRTFTERTIHEPLPTDEEIQAILRSVNKFRPEDELNCGACGYSSCREKAIAVYQGLAEAQMCLPYLIEQLQENVGKLEQLNRDLATAQEELVHAERLASMGQLAAGVAHEINNPLGTILIYSSLMLKGLPTGDPRRDDLAMVVSETTRCRDIVAGLLNFARQSRLVTRETDLNVLVEETLAQVERQPTFEKVTIVRHYAPDLPHLVLDGAQMRQVFLNVVVNAAEAMPEGGTLTVKTWLAPDGQSAKVSFTDTGCGISEENLGQLFTPFFTTKQLGKGTGLGLPIAYGIVKMHRGQIEVQSTVGVGTTFTIGLPLQVPMTGALIG
ncbi:MAG: histidine kinase [Chloroflexi bacterium]|nr:histidine kinase [Chloroflexota bacterium]